MGFLSSLRRRLQVRVIHGTSAGFGPGDRLIINLPGHMTEETVRALWEALKSNFPDRPFQLFVGFDARVTVVEGCGCHCACNAASNTNQQRSAGDASNTAAHATASTPQAAGLDGVPAVGSWSVLVPPQPIGKAFTPGAHMDSSRVVFPQPTSQEAAHG